MNRNVKPVRKKDASREQRRNEKHLDILDEFSKYWASLDEARQKMRRSVMYAYEDQWEIILKTRNGFDDKRSGLNQKEW